MILKKGLIRVFPTAVTKDDTVQIKGNCRSVTFINSGGVDATLFDDDVSLPLAANSSITLGGYDDSYRNEFIQIKFAGAGITKVVVLQDLQIEEPQRD